MRDFVSAVDAAKLTGQSERTIRRWIENGKFKAEKYGPSDRIALADLEPFLEKKPPDVKVLLARVQALEDLEERLLSQTYRIVELERRVMRLEQQIHTHPLRKPKKS